MSPDFRLAKLRIGDKGTSSVVGEYEVLDIFAAIKSQEIAYKVRSPDGGDFIFSEQELLEP